MGECSVLMLRKPTTSSSESIALWSRRANALRASSSLLADKPNWESWTDREYRIWRYATAISHRLDKLQ